jgi:hypothetical protein
MIMGSGGRERAQGAGVEGEDPVRSVLTDQSRRRLANQVARAYRGTYGARTGLRSLGRLVALRMIGEGWSSEAVTAALARVVLDHSGAAGDEHKNLVTGETRSTELVEVMRRSVADAVLEISQRPRPSA